MAIVKYAAPVDEVAGSIGGTVFQRGPYGHTARIRAKPVHKRTPASARQTSLVSIYSWAWYSQLNQGQRDAWDARAAATTWVNSLGENYSPSGQNAYIRSNIVAQSARFAPVTDPPALLDEVDPGFTMDYNAPQQCRITNYGTLAAPPNGRVITWRGGPAVPSSHTFRGSWVWSGAHAIQTLPGPPFTVYNLPAVHPDVRVFFRFRLYRNQAPSAGRSSFPFYHEVFCAAAP